MIKFIMNKSINKYVYILIILLLLSSCSSSDERTLKDCLNTFSSSVNNGSLGESEINKIQVIGHAYGSHKGDNLGLAKSVLNYFESHNFDNQILILTGDIVRDSTIQNLQLVKNQIEKFFNEYYIAVGNHDLGKSKNNFYDVFESDLNFIKLYSADLIVANFTANNWKPSLDDQASINEFISQSSKDTIILFSHQVYWFELTEKTPELNAWYKELEKDAHKWLKTSNKNVIVISGDYGVEVPETFCEYDKLNNILYIASGISDNPEDRGLLITDTIGQLRISEVKLSED
jgi:predicted phosphodiesterase